MKAAERNAFISDELERLINRVRAGEGPKPRRYKSERAVLERLIPIQTDGFRGVALTAIMGKMINEEIDTSNEFDSINPRGVYESGIRPILKKHRIPSGRSTSSAPLNVAKNVKLLDEDWAQGRKPESAALAAVEYVRRVNRHWSNIQMRDDLIMMFLQRLLSYADEVASNDIEMDPIDGAVPIELAQRLSTFALANPERGSMPQFVIGALLAAFRSTDSEYAEVGGIDASVFGTNTTSNKPADLWEVLPSGAYGNLYEVTCKPVDIDRLDAAVDSFSKLGLPNSPITFICRIPLDCADLTLVSGAVVHRGVSFQFIDFSNFVDAIVVMLSPTKRALAFQEVDRFVSEPACGLKTKRAWAAAFGAILDPTPKPA